MEFHSLTYSPSLIDSRVLEKLLAYLDGTLSLSHFHKWFAPVAWELGREDTTAHGLARSVELRLAEYTSGHWSEEELRAALDELVPGTTRRPRVRWTPGEWRPAQHLRISEMKETQPQGVT